MAKPMSDKEIRTRKKVQGHLSQATGTLGLAALGTRLGAKKAPLIASKVGRLKSLTPEKMKDVSNTLATTGAGLGGAGSFNFAAYTGAEAKKKQPVRKSVEYLDTPTFGEVYETSRHDSETVSRGDTSA